MVRFCLERFGARPIIADMKSFGRSLFFVLAVLMMGAGSGLAAEPSRETPAAKSNPVDVLFAALAASRDPQEGKALAAALRKELLRSGSASVDLLMERGMDAFNAKAYDRAFFYFDEVVTLAPDFTEGWSKRATVYYLRNDYTHALRDLEHVLRLEPRHIDAMMGLAVMLQDLGDKKGALDLFRRVLKADPWIEGAADRIKALEEEKADRGI